MIKGKRAFLANLLYYTGIYRSLRHFHPKSLVIFNYHRIRSEKQKELLFDEGVYGPTQEEIYEHLKWLSLNANIISEQDLLDHVRGRKDLPHSSVMVTFDDGYRDNAELALPIIKEFRIPAVFFISTRAIEERELGWWDTIAYLIKKTKRRTLIVKNKVFDLSLSKKGAIEELQSWMRMMRADETRFLVEEIALACGVSLPDFETRSRELMSWFQIKEAIAAGITIGSHTHTHRVLATLSLSEQLEEFKISKIILERELKQTVRSIAYPVGSYHDYYLETGALAEQSGYELAFSFQTGSNAIGKMNPFGIRRVSAEESIPLTCAAVSFPTVFAPSKCGTGPKIAYLTEHLKEETLLGANENSVSSSSLQKRFANEPG